MMEKMPKEVRAARIRSMNLLNSLSEEDKYIASDVSQMIAEVTFELVSKGGAVQADRLAVVAVGVECANIIMQAVATCDHDELATYFAALADGEDDT
jgi:uncharacterized protein YejL (UPF0352 family)